MKKMQKHIALLLMLLFVSVGANAQSITNASFEDGTNGWTVNKMQVQGNDGMSTYKAGNNYLERWIASGSLLGYASVKQTVTGLTNGVYRLSAAAMNISQQNENAAQVGAWIVGNGLRTAVTTRNTYTLDFFVTDGTAEIGFVAEGASGNWVGCDNFTLTYLGNTNTYIQSAGNTVKNYANNLVSSYGSDSQFSSLISTLTSAISNGNLTTVANAAKAVVAGERAYRLRHPSGSAPTVTGNKRTARGSIWIFGRLTWSGSNVVEEGFCYSTSPNPTLETANYTTDWTDSYGKVIWIQNLTPGTMYYIRPYAITKNYAVGYGDVVKVPTIPQGDIHWGVRDSGDETADNHIRSSCEWAFDQWWDNLTQLTTFWPSIGHVSGVPTAECSYGGWCSVGDSWSYQNPGTIMHEMLHGVGVGQHWMWGDFVRDQYPVWDALRFWNNNDTEVLNGDGMHLWPYGINGAHEDNGSDQLYIGNGLICEALGEGGLPLTDGQWLLPYYAFQQDDNTKYYIKNENKDRGLITSYLVVNNSGNMVWQEMSAAEAQSNDKAAWYITFDASTQRYHIKNASTNKYISYNDGFTMSSTATDIQMKKCRVDVSVGSQTYNGLYFLDYGSGKTLEAQANGAVGTTGFSIWDDATTQRWIIMAQGDEVAAFETGAIEIQLAVLQRYLNGYTAAKNVSHTDNTSGATTALTNTINTINSGISGSPTMDQVLQYIEDIKAAGLDFLNNTKPSNGGYYDLTFLIENADFTNSTEGWSETHDVSNGHVEFYETTFDFYQILPNMPNGKYQYTVDAFQRPGSNEDVYTAYTGGTDNVSAVMYINSTSQKIKNVMSGQQSSSIANGEYTTAGNTYVPNNRESAQTYLARNKYNNVMQAEFPAGNLRIGLRGTVSNTYYWTSCDNFKLYYLGSDGVVLSVKEQLAAGGFNQIDALPADYSPYFFTFYDHDQDYNLFLSTNYYDNYKRRAWYGSEMPTTRKSALWTLDSYTLDNTEYQIFANATNPDNQFQTDWQAAWQFNTNDNNLWWGRTSFAFNGALPDGYWTIRNGVYPDTNYLGLWDGSGHMGENANTALNKSGADIGQYDIFTILRGDYVKRYDTAYLDATYNNPLDITYVLENPGAQRQPGGDGNMPTIGWKHTGADWTVSNNGALTGAVGSSDGWTGGGNRYFEISTTSESTLYQEIQGLPSGYYRFSAIATGNGKDNNLKLFANSKEVAVGAGNTGARTSVVININDETLRVGAIALGNDAEWVKFDDAKLEYLGISIPGYNVGTPTSNISNGIYGTEVLSTWTLSFSEANSNVSGAVFAKIDNSAKASLYKGNTKVGDYIIYLSGTTASVSFTGVTLDANSTYTLNFPAGAVGYAGQMSNEAFTVTFQTPVVFDGYYYVKNNETNTFLSRGADYGTAAALDNYGLAVYLSTDNDGSTTFQFFDSRQWLYGNGNVWTDQGNIDNALKFTVQAQGNNIYKFLNKAVIENSSNNYLAVYEGKAVSDARPGDNLVGNTNQWTLESVADHTANYTTNANAQAAALGISGVSTWAQLESKVNADYSPDEIFTDATAVVDHWQWGAGSHYEHTLTDLPNGIYRVSVNALQRACYWDRMWEVDNTNGVRDVAYVYANDQMTQLIAITEGGDVYDDNGDMHEHNGLYYPDRTWSAERAFNAGHYMNYVYVRVTDGSLHFGIYDPSKLGNINQWIAFQNVKVERMLEGQIALQADINNGVFVENLTSVTLSPTMSVTSATLASGTKVTLYKDDVQVTQITPTLSGTNLVVTLPTLDAGATYKLTLDQNKVTFNNGFKNSAFELTFKTSIIPSGTYKLYNKETNSYLGLKENDNRIWVTETGETITWTVGENGCTIKFNDSNKYLAGRWWSETNNDNGITWEAIAYNEGGLSGYKLMGTQWGDDLWKYLYVSEETGDNALRVASNGRCAEDDNGGSNFTSWTHGVWEFVPVSQIIDVNNDNAQDFGDATAIARILTGHKTDANNNAYNEKAADIDNDGHVTLKDLTMLINKLLE